MKRPVAPGLESRRAADFERELRARAGSWLQSWNQDASAPDFGLALLKIAARYSSEVAERLDIAGEKMALGFLDWLGMKAEAARPARVPLAFKLAETASAPVAAPHPVKLQADAGGGTVTFETETDLRIVPGAIEIIVGVDPAKDEYYLPPPGLTALDPLDPLPIQWRLKSFATAGTSMLQLDPGLGLSEGLIVEIAGAQYEVRKAQDDLVTIAPDVPAEGFAENTVVKKVDTFRPFDDHGARNRQEHILYVGDPDLLDVEAAGSIELTGLTNFDESVRWEYWGKGDDADDAEAGWRELEASTMSEGVLLKKGNGGVEPTQVGPVETRWIRATRPISQSMITVDGVKLRVNPLQAGETTPEAIKKIDWEALLRPEIFVNSTSSPPNDFYLLGREPRMFDTLYLGSDEAFSKPGATAWIQFDLADSTFTALSALRLDALANRVIAGVGKDGALHLFSFAPQTGLLAKYRDLAPLRPPNPGGGAADSSKLVQLDNTSRWPLPIWINISPTPDVFDVATWSNDDVWCWSERGQQSTWDSLGRVPSVEVPPNPISGLIQLYDTAQVPPQSMLVALRDGKLWSTYVTATPAWTPIAAGSALNFMTLAPVQQSVGSDRSYNSVATGLIGVTDGMELYHIDVVTGICTVLLPASINPNVRPAAALDANNHLVVVCAEDGTTNLLAYEMNPPAGAVPPLSLASAPIGAISVIHSGDTLNFVVTTEDQNRSTLVSWPRTPAGFSHAITTDLPSQFGVANGAPLMLPDHALIPGKQAEIFVAEFDLSNRINGTARIEQGVLMPSSFSPPLLTGDIVAMVDGGVAVGASITNNGDTKDGETLHSLDHGLPVNGALPVLAYRATGQALIGIINGNDLQSFRLAPGEQDTAQGDWLLIENEFYEVTGFGAPIGNRRVATIDPPFNGGQSGNQHYFRPIRTGGRPASYMTLNPAGNGNWAATLLERMPILFPGSVPDRVRARAFTDDASGHPMLVVLGQTLTTIATPPNTPFVIDAAVGEWTKAFGDTSTNPDLAWEYWDGTSWLRLRIDEDRTSNFRGSGAVIFKVPADLQAVEWAGKISHWIRARLIGGDYGRENVFVISEPGPNANQTKQTVIRSTEGIQPPFALNVGIAYATDKQAAPQFLLTQDSGMLRDQSDANRTPGANIEVFTPLYITLGRLDGLDITATQDGAGNACGEPNCGCGCATEMPGQSEAGSGASGAATPASASNAPSRARRLALYLGLSSRLLGAPVNILFAVSREGDYDGMAPLRIDALIGNRFVPIVATDDTRALGEAGLVRMDFAVEPTRAELFGQPPLTWLRVTPTIADDDWKPSLSGVYLNAVWARAAETMTRELVGASSGEPNLTLSLARPPVLQNTLELRVREPLGEEERRALLDQDPDVVKYGIVDLPGDWVRWRQVADVADSAPADRVYALDEATGTIRFGDGRSGMIPPTGPDAVVAFSYERADAGKNGFVPANHVDSRSELNLVTAIEGVESVRAADSSAGGVSTEPPERVLQFAPARLRHRGRAVSAADFESLVRERSDQVVQARSTAQGGGIRLVAVMRGNEPAPSRAQQRELRRMLLAVAPSALARPGALTIAGPEVRRMRVDLTLSVATLDVASSVLDEAKRRILKFFDSELGGASSEGWPLGLSPRQEDIALALLDIPHLESIVDAGLVEIQREGAERPWPVTIRANELAMLADDGVRISFETREVVA